MEPQEFPEQTVEFQKPEGWTDEQCGPLPVWTDGKRNISCWKPDWKERLSILLHGKVWLSVHMNGVQPPVALWAERQPFSTEGAK